ncbi:MAG: M23 family metallopeptidase [Acidobacteria bacterium]|nr:M23 family metallopeptidase [Acidobacteriota bacterium]
MQKNDKSYTFLLSHSSKSRIFIKKVEVSKRLLRNTSFSLGVFFILSFVSLGAYGVVNYSGLTQISSIASRNSHLLQNQISNAPANPESFDYSRPGDSDDFTANSGGPFDSDEAEADDAEMERQLKAIQSGGNAANLPTIWAHLGKINNEFGFRRNPFGGRTYEFHAGMDIDGERGDMVVAPANGVVTEAGWKGGYGQMIEIDHGNGLKTRYGHLSKIEVAAGDTLTRGQIIAAIGSTGRSTGPHLHYELRLNDRPINPRRFLPPEPTELTKIPG